MLKLPFILLTLAATIGIPQCSNAATVFTSEINGGNIIPTPIDSGITGFATLELNDEQTQLDYEITLNNASLDAEGGTVTKIHFHTGFPDEVSPFHAFNIYGPSDDADAVFSSLSNPITVAGTWDNGDACTFEGCEIDPSTSKALTDYLPDLLAGGLYINIHTSDEPTGEVRGQITAVSVPEPTSVISLVGVTSAIAFGSYWKRRRKLMAS